MQYEIRTRVIRLRNLYPKPLDELHLLSTQGRLRSVFSTLKGWWTNQYSTWAFFQKLLLHGLKDSNLRPLVLETITLPTELNPHNCFTPQTYNNFLIKRNSSSNIYRRSTIFPFSISNKCNVKIWHVCHCWISFLIVFKTAF